MSGANPEEGHLKADPKSSFRDRLRQFESAWVSGSRPRIEDYLSDVPAEEFDALLRQLVRADAFCRWSRGDVPTVDDYRAYLRYLDAQALAAEIRAAMQSDMRRGISTHRSTRTLGVDGAPAANRYISCPQCHNAIESADPRVRELICEACGSLFRIEDVEAETTRQQEPQVIGRFQLLERVGGGSFGTVWRARDTELRRFVAVKIPYANLVDSSDYRERFLREARAAAQLDHPGIVRLYDVPVINGSPVLVSDFIDGAPLRELLQASRPPFQVTAALVAEVAEALRFAHSRGLVHRDVKPGNIMVRFEKGNDDRAPARSNRPAYSGLWGKPIIVDFGLALRDQAEIVMTMEGQVIGTPAYMSPEQVRHAHRVDGRSDLYSLGVVLYEMLCGELPFRGSKAMIVHQVLNEEPRPPRQLNDRIPRDLETICLKAMAKQPSWRYQDCAEMADDLRRFLRAEPILARPVSGLERAWRWCRGSPLVANLWGAVALLLIAGTGVSSYFAMQASNRASQASALAARERRSAREARDAEHARNIQWYDSLINLAGTDWREHRPELMLRKLEDLTSPLSPAKNFAGFELHYLRRLARMDLGTFTGHGGDVTAVAFAKNGRWVVSAGVDGTVRIWDLTLGKEIRRFQGHKGPVNCLAVFPDGSRIVSGGDDRTVRIWRTDGDATEQVLTGHGGPITGMSLTKDGSRLAVVSGGQTRSGDLPGEVLFWNLKTGRQDLAPLRDHRTFEQIALRPDGKQLALVVQAEPTNFVWLWDCTARRLTHEFPEKKCGLHSVCFSPDGRRLAWGGDNQTLRIWDQVSSQVFTLARHPGRAYFCLAFSPDGNRVAAAGNDQAITVWDAAAGAELVTLAGHRGPVRSIAFDSVGRRLASGSSDGTVKIWDSSQPMEPVILREPKGSLASVAFDQNGRVAYSAGHDIMVRDPQGWKSALTISGLRATARGLVFSRDARRLVFGDDTGFLEVRDALTGLGLLRWRAHQGGVLCAAVSPDGNRLLSGGQDRTAKIWSVNEGKELFSLPKCLGAVRSAAFSQDGHLLTYASEDGTVNVWSSAEGCMKLQFRKHDGAAYGVAFHPSGALVASAGADGTVRLWEPFSGNEIHVLSGHGSGAAVVCFSPDGARLATADWEGVVRIWDVATGGQLLSLEGHSGPVFGLAFSPSGLQLASASADTTLRLWDASPITPSVLEQRDATSLVDYLLAQDIVPAEVLRRIHQDSTLSEATKRKALDLTREVLTDQSSIQRP